MSPVSAEPLTKRFRVSLDVVVYIDVSDPAALSADRGADFCGGKAPEDILEHLAFNCVVNQQENASMLDGFADLPEGAVRMQIDREVEVVQVLTVKSREGER